MGSKEGKQLKILVEIDPTQPLIRGITIKMNGILKQIDFRYEKCPDFCYCCGILEHNERNCKDKGANIHSEQQFGAWLRASTPRSPTKKYNMANQPENNNRSESKNDKGMETFNWQLLLTWKSNERMHSIEEVSKENQGDEFLMR